METEKQRAQRPPKTLYKPSRYKVWVSSSQPLSVSCKATSITRQPNDTMDPGAFLPPNTSPLHLRSAAEPAARPCTCRSPTAFRAARRAERAAGRELAPSRVPAAKDKTQRCSAPSDGPAAVGAAAFPTGERSEQPGCRTAAAPPCSARPRAGSPLSPSQRPAQRIFLPPALLPLPEPRARRHRARLCVSLNRRQLPRTLHPHIAPAAAAPKFTALRRHEVIFPAPSPGRRTPLPPRRGRPPPQLHRPRPAGPSRSLPPEGRRCRSAASSEMPGGTREGGTSPKPTTGCARGSHLGPARDGPLRTAPARPSRESLDALRGAPAPYQRNARSRSRRAASRGENVAMRSCVRSEGNPVVIRACVWAPGSPRSSRRLGARRRRAAVPPNEAVWNGGLICWGLPLSGCGRKKGGASRSPRRAVS